MTRPRNILLSRTASGSLARALDRPSGPPLFIGNPFMRSYHAAKVRQIMYALLAMLDPRAPKPPQGMRWRRIGLKWNLLEGSTLMAYIECDCGPGRRRPTWTAVYKPDTTDAIAWSTRYQAQRDLLLYLSQSDPRPASA
jgi:hypothetical protein